MSADVGTAVESGSTVDILPPVGFGATLASEWTKLVSLRSARVTLLVGTLVGIGLTALLESVVLGTWDDWPAADRASFDLVETALVGTLGTTVFFSVLGVTAVSSEYSSRMIALTLTATPRRGRVLAAKLLVICGATLVASLVATTAMVLLAAWMLGGLDLPPVDRGQTIRTVLGVALLSPLLPYIAATLTFVVRSAAGAVASVLALLFVPAALGPLLPAWWREEGQRYLPGAAADSLSLGHLDLPGQLSMPVAAVVVASWVAAFAAAAAGALLRRDA